MRAYTKTYTHNGSFIDESIVIDLGKFVTASSVEPKIISLYTQDVESISNIHLNIIDSDGVDIQEGAITYYVSNDIVEDYSDIKKINYERNQYIHVKNSDVKNSEYVYIWIDPTKIFFEKRHILEFKWSFDYIEPSFSSSSSSSCIFGEFENVNSYEMVEYLLEPCEIKYFNIHVEPESYVTIFINWNPITIENNGGLLFVNSQFILDKEFQTVVSSGGEQYSLYLIDTEPFFIRLYKIGDCSINDHLLLSNNGSLILIDNFRLRLLGDSRPDGDSLLLSDDEHLYLVDGFNFLLIGRGLDYSSSSSSSAENRTGYAVYGILNGSIDYGNTFVVTKSWFGNGHSPYGWDFSEGLSWDKDNLYGRIVVETGQECNSLEECNNINYTFNWDIIPNFDDE